MQVGRNGRPEFFFSSYRPTRIAVSIRRARCESPGRFASPDANRSVDSRRPTRIALSIRVGRRESMQRGASFICENLKASRLDTFAELEALPGTKMISATRHSFYMLDSAFWLTRSARLSAGFFFCRLAVLDFRLTRLFGDSL